MFTRMSPSHSSAATISFDLLIAGCCAISQITRRSSLSLIVACLEWPAFTFGPAYLGSFYSHSAFRRSETILARRHAVRVPRHACIAPQRAHPESDSIRREDRGQRLYDFAHCPVMFTHLRNVFCSDVA
jgi:hypothetical protein